VGQAGGGDGLAQMAHGRFVAEEVAERHGYRVQAAARRDQGSAAPEARRRRCAATILRKSGRADKVWSLDFWRG
jgi:hypothetical protein